jgi:hypothetical protein
MPALAKQRHPLYFGQVSGQPMVRAFYTCKVHRIEEDGFPAARNGESSISGTSFFVVKSELSVFNPYPGMDLLKQKV